MKFCTLTHASYEASFRAPFGPPFGPLSGHSSCRRQLPPGSLNTHHSTRDAVPALPSQEINLRPARRMHGSVRSIHPSSKFCWRTLHTLTRGGRPSRAARAKRRLFLSRPKATATRCYGCLLCKRLANREMLIGDNLRDNSDRERERTCEKNGFVDLSGDDDDDDSKIFLRKIHIEPSKQASRLSVCANANYVDLASER